MTAAVPDPRFRDQLAEDRRAPWIYNEANGWVYGPDPDHAGLRYPYVYAADPEQCRILVAKLNADAAEVEARVQAAAKQRAVDRRSAAALCDLTFEVVGRYVAGSTRNAIAMEVNRRVLPAALGITEADLRTALASPAPAPRAEEGQW